MTVISWCTYPVVYLFPMIGIISDFQFIALSASIIRAPLEVETAEII